MENENQQKLASLIEEIKELLNEIKKEQINQIGITQKFHKEYMHNFSKLREFNKIADMTNQVFEKRISNIEVTLKNVLKNHK